MQSMRRSLVMFKLRQLVSPTFPRRRHAVKLTRLPSLVVTYSLIGLLLCFRLRPDLDTVGLFARDLRELATLQAIATGVPPAPPAAELKGVRVGVCRTFNWHQVLPDGVDGLERAGKELKSRGAIVHDVDMPDVLTAIEDSFRVISSVEGARALAAEARDHFDQLNYGVQGGQKTATQLFRRNSTRLNCTLSPAWPR